MLEYEQGDVTNAPFRPDIRWIAHVYGHLLSLQDALSDGRSDNGYPIGFPDAYINR